MPSSQGHKVGPPVFASVAGGTETSADAPPAVEPEVDAVDGVDPDVVAAALVDDIRNGAENTWGFEKSFWLENIPNTHSCVASHTVPFDAPRSAASGRAYTVYPFTSTLPVCSAPATLSSVSGSHSVGFWGRFPPV